jgi:Tfp pilus assembly protein PilN
MSTVQFNLLPDIKMTYVKAARSRNMVISLAFVISAVAIGLFVILFFSVNVVQKKMLGDADKDITRLTEELKKVTDVEPALTSQQQLNSLTTLHQNKHITSRLFTYLPQITPANVTISSLTVDFTSGTIVLEGTADSQVTVNTFIDTLKFTTYKIGDSETSQKAFPTVTESSFGINTGNVSYGLTISYDPALFANNSLDSEGKSKAPTLVVPKLTTTHSSSNDPADTLFKGTGGQ